MARIVLVDDDKGNAMLLGACLVRHEVQIFLLCEEAVRFLATCKPGQVDLVITDGNISKRGDGVTVVIPTARKAGIKVILMSSSQENLDAAKELGVPIMRKPFSPILFQGFVEGILKS